MLTCKMHLFALFVLLFLSHVCASPSGDLFATTTEMIQTTTHYNEENQTDIQTTTFINKEMERIVKPMTGLTPSQTQLVNHKIAPILNITAHTDVSKVRQFRPSPQLESYYEFNRNPVTPALSEAKHFGSVEKVPWIEKTQPNQPPNNYYIKQTPENPWTTNVRFPNSYPITVKDHPYQYEKELDQSSSGNFYGQQPKISTGHVKPNYDIGGPKYAKPFSMANWFGGGDSWDKTIHKHIHKKPAKTLFDSHDDRVNTDLSSSPWKKIIKILTAFIPIGLLISALTPSVITIHPMNMTNNNGYNRGRLVDGPKPYGLNLLNDLQANGCDQRILCEILLSAEENKNLDNVDTLLENYTQGIGGTEKLEKIYKGVKMGDCSNLFCKEMDLKNA